MIAFKKIRWKNLLSTGNSFTEILLDKTPTTLVCGENGAGKTTMLDALTFVLYGKPYRNINLPQLVNSINGKDCVVEIEFTVNASNYKVIRGIAPKILIIEKDGKQIDQTANVKDYQIMLETNILKMNYKTFCQVVILGSTNYVPFMRLSAADRRNIVENLLDIDVFSRMNEALKTRMVSIREDLRGVEMDIETVKLKIVHKKDLIRKIEEKSDSQLESYKESVENEKKTMAILVERRDALREEMLLLSDGLVSIDDQRESISKMSSIQKQMLVGVKKAKEEKAFYEENEECPVCKNSLPSEFRHTMIEKKGSREKELSVALSEMEVMVNDSKKRMEDTMKVLDSIRQKKEDVSTVDSQIESSKKYMNQFNNLIERTLGEKDSLYSEKNDLESLGEHEVQLEEKRRMFVEDSHLLEIAAVLLKDGGIKRKIIRKYIPALNKIINKYLVSMDFFAQFSLDENFNEIIKSRHRDEFSYENFSEGEKLRIDLSLLLAWRDIAKMKNSANTNLLILDEVFDSSLDAVGTEEVTKILQNMGRANNIFVISHKSDQLIDKFGNILSFKKVNNFSTLS